MGVQTFMVSIVILIQKTKIMINSGPTQYAHPIMNLTTIMTTKIMSTLHIPQTILII